MFPCYVYELNADKFQKTALMLLSHREHFHLDSFRMVLSLQASVDLQDAEGNTGAFHPLSLYLIVALYAF